MNKVKVIEDFKEFIKIQSISVDSTKIDEMIKATGFLSSKLKSLGFKITILEKEKALPLIIGEKIVNPQAQTIGIYGHYDVQPADPLDKWLTDPFTLTLKNGKIFGRGTADNKGHVIQNITAIEQLINEKKLSNNIIFIIEGEEEANSANFESYIKEVKDILAKIDVFYVTDVGMHWRNIPQIFYGLRGILYFDIKVWIGEHDLHSGVYGNKVYNPVQILSYLFTKIQDPLTRKILIPGFYEQVRKVSKKELELLAKAAVEGKMIAKEAQVFTTLAQDKYPPYLVSKLLPSFDVDGIISGYTGEGAKTIIPAEAKAKFSFRLVENQDPDAIDLKVHEFVKNIIPQGVKYELNTLEKNVPFYTSIDNPITQKTANILSEVFGNETIFNRTGGSVPAAEIFQRLFKKPIILIGFTLPDDNLHAPNENFDEEMFWKGIEALKKIYNVIS